MYQQQPPQWQPPRPRPKKPVPKWVWYVAAGWVAAFVVLVVLVAVFDPPKDTSAAPSSSTTAPAASRTPTAAQPSSSSPPLSARVTKAQFGKDRPFVHITAGTVRCIPREGAPGEVIFVADDGRTFGLNGTALDGGYKDIPAGEWRKNPDIPGASIDIAPLRDPVAKACGL